MFKCDKCDKIFKYDSDYQRHLNRKTLCNDIKNIFECGLCNISFNYKSKYNEHEKTKKHIINIQNQNVDNENNKHILNNEIKYNDRINELKIKYENDKEDILNRYQLQIDNLKNKYEIQINNLKQENTNLKNKYEIQIDNLKQENTNLKNKFNLLQSLSNSNKIKNIEYIYIIHERTFVLTNTNIYKVGRTNDINRRFKQYSKGSKIVFTMPCNNSIEIEAQILNHLKSDSKYVQATEFGNEYFICNVNDLISDIYTFFNHI